MEDKRVGKGRQGYDFGLYRTLSTTPKIVRTDGRRGKREERGREGRGRRARGERGEGSGERGDGHAERERREKEGRREGKEGMLYFTSKIRFPNLRGDCQYEIWSLHSRSSLRKKIPTRF
jgi:hypothetical protein